MAETHIDDEALGRALAAAGRDLAFPPTPAFESVVTSRLHEERAGRVRRPLAGLALWSRRRALVLIAVGLLALLGIAAAARLVIGVVEIRVQPGASASESLPPVEPGVLGDPVPLDDVVASIGFAPATPAGPPPDGAYVIEGPEGTSGVILAWRPSARYPVVPGTEWGLLLMAFASDAEPVVKTTSHAEDSLVTAVNGRRAAWITVPHPLILETERGVLQLSTTGNVLIWEAGELTYRLETSLGLQEALELARSVA